MNDAPTFLQFSNQGQWTTDESISIPDKTEGLDFAFHNYITSQVMGKNGWYGFVDEGSLDPNKYQTIDDLEKNNFQGGVKCDRNTNICASEVEANHTPTTKGPTGRPIHGQLDQIPQAPEAWWYSNTTKRVYTVRKPKMDKALGTKKMLENIISQQWGNLDIILDGSFNFTWQGRTGSVAIDLDPNGNLDFSCISQLPIKRACSVEPCFSGSYMNGSTCPFEKVERCNIQSLTIQT